jgi:putative NADH-flavin reductase
MAAAAPGSLAVLCGGDEARRLRRHRITGLALVTQVIEAGHEVTAFVRDAAKLGATRARVVTGNVLDPAEIEPAIRGGDAVFSCLGTRPWRHTDVCSEGTRAIAAAMTAAGVKRIIVLSSQGVGDSRMGLGGRVFAGLLLGRAFRDKVAMEEHLATTPLEWIAVRPGILTNGPPRGTWRAAAGGELVGGKIARADVAAFMLQQATSTEWVRKRPTLVW